MAKAKGHELFKDACLTLGHLIETRVPRYLGGDKLEVVYDPPEEDALQKALKKKKTVLVSVVFLDAKKSSQYQTTNQPIVHEEDEEGNLVEYRCGPPTVMEIRALVTPWVQSSLDGATVLGAISKHFASFSEAGEDEVRGESMSAEDRPAFDEDTTVPLDERIKLWGAMMPGRPFRPCLIYKCNLKMDSAKRTAIRRVREKVNLYRKLEG